MNYIKRAIALLLTIPLFFTHASAEEKGAYIVTESSTCSIISSENAEKPLPCAGLVRLMSLLVIGEAIGSGEISASDEVTVSIAAAKTGGSSVFLDADSSYPADALYGAAVICSANDAIIALCEHLAGSEEAFIGRMNSRAKELGLSCVFEDATGIKEQKMSALDLSKICSSLCECPVFMKYSSTWLEEFTHQSGRKTQMSSANILIKEDCDGMATSSSPEAGYCLAASKRCGDAHYICIVLGNDKKGRFELARKELASASEYVPTVIARAGSEAARTEAEGTPDSIPLCAKEDLILLLKKTDAQNLKRSLEINELTLPLSSGDDAGKLVIELPSGEKHEIPLAVMADIKANDFSGAVSSILKFWLFKSA